MQSEIVKEIQKATLLEKYNVDHAAKIQKNRDNASKKMCEYNENLIKNHRIKKYKDTNIYYQSLHELRFIEYCEKENLLKHLDNSPTFQYRDKQSNRHHLPDFKFCEKYIIEIKSSYWLERQGGYGVINLKKESVEDLGYKYVFILDEDYTEFLFIIQNQSLIL